MSDHETFTFKNGLTKSIDRGSFDQMFELASERANAEGGAVVVHKSWCDDPQAANCLCQPLIVEPYSRVDESATEGLLQ